MKPQSKLSRRQFVIASGATAAAAALAACAPQAAPTTAPTTVPEPTKAAEKPTEAPKQEPTKAPEAAQPTAGAPQDQNVSNRNLEQIAKLSDKKIDVKGWHIRMWVSAEGINGLNDQLFDKKMEELTNVHINWQSEAGGGPAFDVMMASGDIPDIMSLFVDNGLSAMSSYGMKGAIAPIDDYINQNPYLATRMKANPHVRAMITAPDGHIYLFPRILEGAARVYAGIIVRQDWLKDAGVEAPTKIEQVYDVCKAVKAKDSKRFPLDIIAGGASNISSNWVVWQFGVDAGFIQEEGKAMFGPLHSEYKTALAFLKKCLADGLINPEFQQYTAETWIKDLLGGVIGICDVNNDHIGNVVKEAPADDWEPIAMPVGPRGHHQNFRNYGDVDRWSSSVISAKSQYKDALAKYLDLYYSDSGSTLQYYGIYGDTYEEKDGKKVWTDKVLKSKFSPNEYGFNIVGPNWFGAAYMSNQEWLDLNPGKLGKAIDLWTKSDPSAQTQSQLPDMILTEDEQNTIKTVMPDINTLVSETVVKFVKGELNLEADFTDFQAKIKSMGIDDAVKAYQSAFERYKKLLG